MNCWSFLGLVALASAITYSKAEYRRVCYVTNWAQYRPQPGTFFPEQMDPSLCSHIMFAFAVLDSENRIIPYEWNDDIPGGLYEQTIAHKEKEPDLKVSISVGGENFGMTQISIMLSTPANRRTFIDSVVVFCRDRDFDGVDLAFAYPGSGVSPPEDKYRYTELLKEFRNAIDNEAASSGRTALLLTALAGAGQMIVDSGYEIPEIFEYLNFASLKTYDFSCVRYTTVTVLHAPLYPARITTCNENVDWGASYWVSLGAPKEKLVIGLALYGRGFTLADEAQNGLGAPVLGPCKNGTYTRDAGFLSYFEICSVLDDGAIRVFHDEHKAPYAYKGDQWVGYDDEYSISLKVEYIMANCFSGWMAWSVDLDDFSGNLGCNAGPYPLLHVANEVLETATPTCYTTSTAAPTTTLATPATPATTTATTAPPTATTTTAAPTTTTATTATAAPFSCDGKPDGYYVNPGDCTSFIMCSHEVKTVVECDEGLYYDDINKTCNWSYNLSPERLEECGLA